MEQPADPVQRAFLGVERAVSGNRWISRLDQAGQNRALAIAQTHGLPFRDLPQRAGTDFASHATQLAHAFDKLWRASHPNDLLQTAQARQIRDSESALKIELVRWNREHSGEEFSGPELRAELVALSSTVIDAVVTTSWDPLLERLFPDFQVYVGQNATIRADLMGVGELYKIHRVNN